MGVTTYGVQQLSEVVCRLLSTVVAGKRSWTVDAELTTLKFFKIIGSRPSDHYFRSVCLSVCPFVCLFVCAEFFSAVYDPISIKLGHMLCVWV